MSVNSDNIISVVRKNLIRFRRDKGLTQEKLGLEVGVERSHISHLESGERTPNITILAKIAEVVHRQPYEFFVE